MITSISVLSVVSVTYFVFMIYLGIYAYGNPDPASAYFVDGVDSTALTRVAIVNKAGELDIAVRAGYPINMAHLFRTWFLWGFWGSVFQISILAASIPLCFLFKQQVPILNIVTGIL